MNSLEIQNGASKSSSGAGSGNGVKAVEAPDNASTVVSSETSAPSGKPRTRRGANLTSAQTLEILQQSVVNCQAAGIDIEVTPLFFHGCQSVAIVLEGIAIKDGNLIADIGKGVA